MLLFGLEKIRDWDLTPFSGLFLLDLFIDLGSWVFQLCRVCGCATVCVAEQMQQVAEKVLVVGWVLSTLFLLDVSVTLLPSRVYHPRMYFILFFLVLVI